MDRGAYVSREGAESTTFAQALDRYANQITPGKKRALTPLYAILLMLAATDCGSQESAERDPVARETELAKNDVWHAVKLRGVAFRAIGQEPGWMLEITNGEKILIVTNYGQERASFPYVEPIEDKVARRTEFRIDPETSVLVEGRPCTDSMSGKSFQATVTVKIGKQTLKGCGRALF